MIFPGEVRVFGAEVSIYLGEFPSFLLRKLPFFFRQTLRLSRTTPHGSWTVAMIFPEVNQHYELGIGLGNLLGN